MKRALLFHSTPTIETERLLLRAVRDLDLGDIYEIYSDIETSQYNAWVPVRDMKGAKQKLQSFKSGFEAQQRLRWVIELKDRQKLIGDIALVRFDYRIARAEVGFNLNRKFWNKGYMSEALNAVVDWAFGMDIFSIEALVHTENAACFALLKKNGFEQEGLMRQAGVKYDKRYDLAMFARVPIDSLPRRQAGDKGTAD